METVELRVVRLPHAADLPLPDYQSEHAAGLDLTAAIAAPLVIAPGSRAVIATGIAIALPSGMEGQIRPRSGLALRHGITVLNSPGTVDSDYRGEIHVILINMGTQPVTIERGMRIAQLVLAVTRRVPIREVDRLDETTRGVGGFGSTGTGAGRPAD